MTRFYRIVITYSLLFTSVLLVPVFGQGKAISNSDIEGLKDKLTKVGESSSTARKKLSIRRVIREVDSLLSKNASAENRFEVLHILFKSQQILLTLDNSTANRKAFLETCKKLAAAPNKYAEIRLDADLLLTQAQSARKGGDANARANALRPLVERYRDTDVEVKVIRIAIIMALELGNTRLVNDLRQIIAERFPGDIDLINFQTEKLATQVFGAPFIATFERADGRKMQFPMDFLGTTTMLYFWSKDEEGMESMKGMAAAWKTVSAEKKPAGRFQIISMNMDDLPDAGESILKEHGLDWPALKVPNGVENPIFKTYINAPIPTVRTISPTGYAALFKSGGRLSHTYERILGSSMSRTWTHSSTASYLQSVFSAEVLVLNPHQDFDPSAPPEYTVIAKNTDQPAQLTRTAKSVPAEKLKAIQACFIEAPFRYSLPHEEITANYKKAESLCRETIATHSDAPDLWIVRNRLITALMGLWKAGDPKAFSKALEESETAMKDGYPKGTDIIAQLCLAREALRTADDKAKLIKEFFTKNGGKEASGPALFAASLLALDIGDRLLHDKYRLIYLNRYAETPELWAVTAFYLDRYHRYWMYHPPFTAGWTYGRRQGYFMATGTPEQAQRTIKFDLKTEAGETIKIPEYSKDKWSVISFIKNGEINNYVSRYGAFAELRPFKDVNLIVAVLDENPEALTGLKKQKRSADFLTTVVPGGMKNSLVKKLGFVIEEKKPSLLILRPDGSIAVALSGSAISGSVIQNIIEWQDEKVIDATLAKGDLEEAKRLAFALAPLTAPEPAEPAEQEGNNKNKKKKKIKKPKALKISNPHLRSRAKVHYAMGKIKEALADIEKVFLAVNSKAGHISMRTEELEETEALKNKIEAALKKAEEEK